MYIKDYITCKASLFKAAVSFRIESLKVEYLPISSFF